MTDAYIFDAVRTPRGRGKSDGSLHGTRPIELGKTVLNALKERNKFDPASVDDVVFGCVTALADQGANVTKSIVMYAGYPENVSGVTVNRFCGSGLEAVNIAAARIRSGMENLIIAGGVESMSRVPMMSDGGAWSVDPELATMTHFVPQGISADLIATRRGYTRRDVDEFALNSQKKAAAAIEAKRFAKSIIPVRDSFGSVILDRDEHARPDTTLEGLGQLKPSFEKLGAEAGFDAVALQKYAQLEKINHVHHAGNSSGIVDGSAALLMGSNEIGKKFGLKPRAKVRSMAVVATDPTIMLVGPAPSAKIALERAKLTAKDIDLYEVNEAFAAVVMNFIDDMGISADKVNVNGGSIALGHPLGATGAILAGTVIDELERQNKTLGLVTLCIGGGMGISTIFERV